MGFWRCINIWLLPEHTIFNINVYVATTILSCDLEFDQRHILCTNNALRVLLVMSIHLVDTNLYLSQRTTLEYLFVPTMQCLTKIVIRYLDALTVL